MCWWTNKINNTYIHSCLKPVESLIIVYNYNQAGINQSSLSDWWSFRPPTQTRHVFEIRQCCLHIALPHESQTRDVLRLVCHGHVMQCFLWTCPTSAAGGSAVGNSPTRRAHSCIFRRFPLAVSKRTLACCRINSSPNSRKKSRLAHFFPWCHSRFAVNQRTRAL